MEALTKLTEILRQEIDLQLELMEQVLNMRQAIMFADVKKLDAVNTVEDQLAEKLRLVERERISVIRELAVHYHFDPNKAKLSEIIEKVGGKSGVNLAAQRAQLTELSKKIKAHNDENTHLLNFSLSHIQDVLDAVSRAGSPGNYERSGNNSAVAGSIVLDRTA
jgi:flagellar biosynthesis/type III secretory pathway chaperone